MNWNCVVQFLTRFDSVLLFAQKSANIADIGTRVGEGLDIDGIYLSGEAGDLENKTPIPMVFWSQKRHTSKTTKIEEIEENGFYNDSKC